MCFSNEIFYANCIAAALCVTVSNLGAKDVQLGQWFPTHVVSPTRFRKGHSQCPGRCYRVDVIFMEVFKIHLVF